MTASPFEDSTVASFFRSCMEAIRPMVEGTPDTEFVAAVIYLDQHNGMSIMVTEPEGLSPEEHDSQVRTILSAALEASMFDEPTLHETEFIGESEG